jgi:hypothetical protein
VAAASGVFGACRWSAQTLKRTWIEIVVALLVCGTASADCPPGDLNGDCRVDAADLVLFAGQWLTPGSGLAPADGSLDSSAGGGQTAADLNRDGRVDGTDLAVFSRCWRQRNCPIVISEILAHAHGAASDWIELHNVSTIPVALGGWFLSDSKNDLQRYQIAAGTILGPHEYLVLYETLHFANPFDSGVRQPFAFTENGETAYLYSGDDAAFPDVLIEQRFGASETGSSFGRYATSLGTHDFVTLAEPTPGAANSYPRVGPIVIEEIMYHPVGNADAEYVELRNVSGAFLTLFDAATNEPWRLTDDSGIDLRFPVDPPLTLGPDERLLLTRDVDALGSYGVPATVPVLAWGSGKLDNAGGTVRLLKPGDVDERGIRYWIEVERVDYSDGSHGQGFPGGLDPWPIQADGFGFALQRLSPTRYANDPNNWQVAFPTPGSAHD